MPVNWEAYPTTWDVMRQGAINEARGRCQGCGADHLEDDTNATCLTVHHPDRDPANADARLTVLCAACHLSIERIAKRRQERINGLKPIPGQLAMGDA